MFFPCRWAFVGRYTVEVDGVGAVSGVPPWALRAPGSAQLLLKPAAVGDRLEVPRREIGGVGTRVLGEFLLLLLLLLFRRA
jgi:hypothetical protein